MSVVETARESAWETARESARESDRPSLDVDPGLRIAATESVVQHIRVGLLGYGRVGQAVGALASDAHATLESAGLELHLVGALVRDRGKSRGGPPVPLWTSAADLFATRFEVLIDVMGGEHPAYEFVRRAIELGAHVVTANKTLVALRGRELAALARRRGVVFAYDAAVLAGVPFLGALARRPLIASPHRITGIINGTSHFIACELERGGSQASALAEAIVRGYAEPDSSADLGGRDAAEKLTILLHLVGCRDVAVSDLTTRSLEVVTAADVLGARALGGVIKPAAIASLDAANPGAWVGPVFVDRAHAFARLQGVTNAIEFAGPIGDPVTFAGPGAGPAITAATILDDVAEACAGSDRAHASGWRTRPAPATALRQPPAGRWFLRVAGAQTSLSEFAEQLAASRLPALGLVECGRALVARTAHAPWSVLVPVVESLRSAGHDVLALPVVQAPGAGPL